MPLITSDALTLVNRFLGIGGRQSAVTDFDDQTLDQVVVVNDIVRRSRTPVGTSGIFAGAFVLEMGAGATVEEGTVDPYDTGEGINDPPYPARIPASMDIWLIGASGTIVAGTASNFTEATLRIVMPGVFEGWGVDEASAAAAESISNFAVARWDSQETVAGRVLLMEEGGRTYAPIDLRIRRGGPRRGARAAGINGRVRGF